MYYALLFFSKFYNRKRQYGFTLNRQSFIFSKSVEMYYYCQKFNTTFSIQVNGRLINLIANLFAAVHLLSSFFYNEKGSMIDILAKEVMRYEAVHSLLDNIYVLFCNEVYRDVVDIHMLFRSLLLIFL